MFRHPKFRKLVSLLFAFALAAMPCAAFAAEDEPKAVKISGAQQDPSTEIEGYWIATLTEVESGKVHQIKGGIGVIATDWVIQEGDGSLIRTPGYGYWFSPPGGWGGCNGMTGWCDGIVIEPSGFEKHFTYR